MSHKGAFDNPFDEYTLDVARNVMDDKLSSISDVFKSKLKNYESNKFKKLTTDLQHDIFHDPSVYTGSSGIALLYYLHATNNAGVINQDLLLEGLKFIPFSDVKRKRISFLCGDGGPLALAIVYSFLLGENRPKELPHYKELTETLIQLKDVAEKKETPDELLYGRAGYLYALLFVNKHVGRELVPASVITKIIQAILHSGSIFAQHMNSPSPLLWQWHDKIYLGAAHGVAGILYILLQARAYLTQDELENLVKPSLDYLLSLRFASGNLPSSKNSSGGDRLVQWCHGAPGLVQLCCLAHEVYRNAKYLNAAVKCGEVTWERGLTSKGYSICHGVAGNAYTFIQLYQATNDPVHLYRACSFTEWCAVERPGTELHKPDRPASMFEGLAGRLYLIADLRNVADAKFPAYTL